MQNQSKIDDKSEGNQMNDFIKEYLDYQHTSAIKTTAADITLPKYSSMSRKSSVLNGQHNSRFEQLDSTAARPIAFIPIKPIHPPDKRQLFQISGNLSGDKKKE